MSETQTDEQFICAVCGRPRDGHEAMHPALIFGGMEEAIREKIGTYNDSMTVCEDCAQKMYVRYIQRILEERKGRLSEIDMQLMEMLEKQETVAQSVNEAFDKEKTWLEDLSNLTTRTIASWRFVGFVVLLVGIWIFVNVMFRPFEPFPMITLAVISAMLGTLAAIEAPVILMSQRRRAKYDRLRADYDYRVNLKAELEVRHLHEKMDQLLIHQWENLLELHKIQLDRLDAIHENVEKLHKNGNEESS